MLSYDSFKQEIVALLVTEIKKLSVSFGVTVEPNADDIFNTLTIPPDFLMGQAALPCFPFAKLFKQAPNKIAEALSAQLNAQPKKFIDKVTHVNAYLNFFAQFPQFADTLFHSVRNQSFFKPQFLAPAEKEKIIVEYSQPNTHKMMHVGHLRCLVLGDAVCNLLEYVGHDIVRATYPGDVGTHVAKILWYLMNPAPKPPPPSNQVLWLGEMYAKADDAVKALKGTPAEAPYKELVGQIFKQIAAQKGEYYELWKETREWSLNYLKEVYHWLNSHFDVWFFESECEAPSKELVKKKFAEGFFVQDAGAIGIDLSAHNLGFAMYLKSDGNGLYLTKDLDLISKKFADPKVTKSIYIVDARQKLHFQQLFKTAELMGYPQAARSVHLPYETVNTEGGAAFSSRQRNGLSLFELKDKMEEKVKLDYLARYQNEWSAEEIQKTAENVTIAALKYGMLKVDNQTQIHFVLNDWLRLDGDTGPYLQYVHARCCSILEKQGRANNQHGFVLHEQVEQELLFQLWRFNEFALQAGKQCRPSHLSNYLYDVAKCFNRFYEACSIKSSEGASKETRLALVEMTQSVIGKGLTLLGITPLERM